MSVQKLKENKYVINESNTRGSTLFIIFHFMHSIVICQHNKAISYRCTLINIHIKLLSLGFLRVLLGPKRTRHPSSIKANGFHVVIIFVTFLYVGLVNPIKMPEV